MLKVQKGLLRRVALGACALGLGFFSSTGCGFLPKAESLRIGAVFREARARWKPYEKRIHLPAVRVQENFPLNESLDFFLRGEFSAGHVDHHQYLTQIRARGSFLSAGAGLSYYPFCDNVSFDFGGEVFYANVRSVKGDFFGVKHEISDDVLGVGVNAGVSLRVPLTENLGIVGSGGYSFTDTRARHLSVDFSGWYVFLGAELKLK
ncbi:hypothetical protein D6817_04455 [Candidatus Pacearchaeota archaeon]|nr:MAG: hypothetical protein D6817_04455 [Candidatus Pacearchaeota archaeon]